MSKLILKSNGTILKEIQLDKYPVTIGRDPNSDIVIDDILVSRHHARIILNDSWYYIEDLNSGNGLFVNNKKITQEVLRDLDEISVGKYALTFMHENRSSIEEYENSEVFIGEKTFVLPINRPEVMALQARKKLCVEEKDSGLTGCIVMLSGREHKEPIELIKTTTVGGKSHTADIKLKGLFVGKNAFIISQRVEGFFITHSEGKRMTKVNGEAVIGQLALRDGDLITIGATKMKFSSKIG